MYDQSIINSVWRKDPDATLDYSFIWKEWLKTGDSLQSVEFTVSPSGELMASREAFTTDTATLYLSGGVAGKQYNIQCRITTANGLITDRTKKIVVYNR